MNNVDLTQYLPILSIGLWTGVFVTIVCKLLSHIVEVFIKLFKMA